ncbi:MAG: hypothetical protein FWC00_02555 [Firmicutes bacterium]|nr:hypothetical protein [Bacillota bacterium]
MFKNLLSRLFSIFVLIKLQFKSRVALPRNRGWKYNTRFGVFVGLGLLAFVAFVYLYYMLTLQFVDHSFILEDHVPRFDLSRPFLVYTLLIFMVLQTVFLVPSLVRNIDIHNERELLLKLPISPRQIFAAKIVVQYMLEIVFATIILLPILIAFGLATQMSVGFFFLIPLVILFIPVIPFFLASLLLYPATKLVELLRSHAVWTSVAYFVGMVGGILLYMFLIESAMSVITESVNFTAYLNTVAHEGNFERTANAIFPAAVFANLLNTTWYTALWSSFAIIGIAILLLVGSYFIAGANYKRTYMEERSTFSTIRCKGDHTPCSPTKAVVKREVKNIFRSSNYTFQFVLMVIVMPLMIYFVNRVAMYSSYQSFRFHRMALEAGGMLFGVSLFVMLITIPLCATFAASSITREGHNLYHTKLMPVSFRRQLTIKFLVTLLPIIASLAVSVGLVMIPYNPDPTDASMRFNLGATDALYLFFVGSIMATGYVCMGCYLDLRKPLASQLGDGELVRSTEHINIVMIVGIIVAVVFGLLAMLGGFGTEVFGMNFLTSLSTLGSHIWWILIVVSIVFASTFATLLFLHGPKKYKELD